MKPKQVVILWCIVLALALVGGWMHHAKYAKKPITTARVAGETIFTGIDFGQVAQLEINSTNGTIQLRQEAGKWLASNKGDYPCNRNHINQLMRAMEAVKVTYGVVTNLSYAKRFGVDVESTRREDRGVTILLKNAKGESLAEMTLGKRILEKGSEQETSPKYLGRYLRKHGDESGFYVTSEMFNMADGESWAWLDDDFIEPKQIKTIRLSEADSPQWMWRIERDSPTGSYHLIGAAPSEALSGLFDGSMKALFEALPIKIFDVISPSDLAAKMAPDGTREIQIETFDGLRYEIKFAPTLDEAAMGMQAGNFIIQVRVKSLLSVPSNDEERRNNELRKGEIFEGRYFQIRRTALHYLLKTREQILHQGEGGGS